MVSSKRWVSWGRNQGYDLQTHWGISLARQRWPAWWSLDHSMSSRHLTPQRLGGPSSHEKVEEFFWFHKQIHQRSWVYWVSLWVVWVWQQQYVCGGLQSGPQKADGHWGKEGWKKSDCTAVTEDTLQMFRMTRPLYLQQLSVFGCIYVFKGSTDAKAKEETDWLKIQRWVSPMATAWAFVTLTVETQFTVQHNSCVKLFLHVLSWQMQHKKFSHCKYNFFFASHPLMFTLLSNGCGGWNFFMQSPRQSEMGLRQQTHIS